MTKGKDVDSSDAARLKIEDDRLGTADYAKGVAGFIRTCDTPLTLAIQGDWGTGKTTLMNFIKESLDDAAQDGTKPVGIICLDTWLYGATYGDKELPLVLLSDLIKKLAAIPGPDKGFGEVVKKRFEDASKLLLRGVAIALEAKTGNGTIAGSVEDFGRALIGNASEDNWATLLKKTLVDTVNVLVEGDSAPYSRLVFFVDDLDRLNPAAAVNTLEVLKNLLEFEGCVFVLALDFSVVEQGLQDKYPKMSAKKQRYFFEKIIQVPFALPVETYDIDRYVESLLQDMAAENFDKQRYTQLIKDVLPQKNPRQIKRAMNLLRLYKSLITTSGMSTDLQGSNAGEADLCLFGLQLLNMSEMNTSTNTSTKKDQEAAEQDDGQNQFFYYSELIDLYANNPSPTLADVQNIFYPQNDRDQESFLNDLLELDEEGNDVKDNFRIFSNVIYTLLKFENVSSEAKEIPRTIPDVFSYLQGVFEPGRKQPKKDYWLFDKRATADKGNILKAKINISKPENITIYGDKGNLAYWNKFNKVNRTAENSEEGNTWLFMSFKIEVPTPQELSAVGLEGGNLGRVTLHIFPSRMSEGDEQLAEELKKFDTGNYSLNPDAQ